MAERRCQWRPGPGSSQRCTGFLLGVVTTTQLLTLAVNHSCVDRQLVAHDRLAADAACELDASDLRRQLPALSHRRFASRGGFGVGGDEAMDFRRGDPAGGPDLNPCQLACLVADGASDPHQAAPDRPGIAFTYVTDGGLTSPWAEAISPLSRPVGQHLSKPFARENRSEDTARKPRVGEELRLPLTGRGWSTTALQPIPSTVMRYRRKPFGYIGFHHPSAATAGLIDEHLQGIVRRSPRAKPETTGCTGGSSCHS